MDIQDIIIKYKDCSIVAICSLAIHNGIITPNYDTLYKEVKRRYSRIMKWDKDNNKRKCHQCGRTFDPNETDAENKNFCCLACEYGY